MDRVNARMIPFLDAFPTVQHIVNAVENDKLGVDAFGPNMLHAMLRCYQHVGRQDDGLRRYDEYLTHLEQAEDPLIRQWAGARRGEFSSRFPDFSR